jgi:hypothetical protein
MNKSYQIISAAFAVSLSLSAFSAAVTVKDAMRSPELKDVRLEGWLGAKMDRFISKRLVDPFLREQIFDEARQAFEFRNDDDARGFCERNERGGESGGECRGCPIVAPEKKINYLWLIFVGCVILRA